MGWSAAFRVGDNTDTILSPTAEWDSIENLRSYVQ